MLPCMPASLTTAFNLAAQTRCPDMGNQCHAAAGCPVQVRALQGAGAEHEGGEWRRAGGEEF